MLLGKVKVTASRQCKSIVNERGTETTRYINVVEDNKKRSEAQN